MQRTCFTTICCRTESCVFIKRTTIPFLYLRKCLVPSIRYQISDVRHRVPGIRYQVPGTQLPGIKYQLSERDSFIVDDVGNRRAVMLLGKVYFDIQRHGTYKVACVTSYLWVQVCMAWCTQMHFCMVHTLAHFKLLGLTTCYKFSAKYDELGNIVKKCVSDIII